jgi:hypothetical protein
MVFVLPGLRGIGGLAECDLKLRNLFCEAQSLSTVFLYESVRGLAIKSTRLDKMGTDLIKFSGERFVAVLERTALPEQPSCLISIG